MSIPMQLAVGLSFGVLEMTLVWRMLRSQWWQRWGDRPIVEWIRYVRDR